MRTNAYNSSRLRFVANRIRAERGYQFNLKHSGSGRGQFCSRCQPGGPTGFCIKIYIRMTTRLAGLYVIIQFSSRLQVEAMW